MANSSTKNKQSDVLFGTYRGQPTQFAGIVTKSVHIPMQDGVQLAADVVLPKNLLRGQKLPTLLSQTRYWRAMELRKPFRWFLSAEMLNPDFKDFMPFFASQGYAQLIVDVRGTGASTGIWEYPWDNKSFKDAYEIIDWIISQPWSNGAVGAHGISYLGTTGELLAACNHPAVKAVLPMFNHPDAYTQIAFPGGIFNHRFVETWGRFDRDLDNNLTPQEFGWLGKLFVEGVKPVDDDQGREKLALAIRDHAQNGDSLSLAQALTYRDDLHPDIGICADDLAVHKYRVDIENSSAVTCGWGSGMDAGTADAVLQRFLTYRNNVRGVIGAWEHGGRYNASPYASAPRPAVPDLHGQWQEMLRFFDDYLKHDEITTGSTRQLYYYTMGAEEWRITHQWPPEGVTYERWYLASGNTLSPNLPPAGSGEDKYTIDFEATTGALNRWWEMGGIENKTVSYPDRTMADRRLLTYTSTPLQEDIEITGHPIATIFITSTAADEAFFVYLEDVDPQGEVIYVTEGQLRAIHRKVLKQETPVSTTVPYHTFRQADAEELTPEQITELTFGLLPTSVLIRKGHRIRIAIAGHDAGTFSRIPAEGQPVITVVHNEAYASSINLPVLRKPKEMAR